MEHAQAHDGCQQSLAGDAKNGVIMRVASGDTESQEGVIVTSHIPWK
jgi:hypothetical protein